MQSGRHCHISMPGRAHLRIDMHVPAKVLFFPKELHMCDRGIQKLKPEGLLPADLPVGVLNHKPLSISSGELAWCLLEVPSLDTSTAEMQPAFKLVPARLCRTLAHAYPLAGNGSKGGSHAYSPSSHTRPCPA